MTEKVIRNVEMVQPKKDDGKNKEKDEGNQTYGAPIYITKLVHGRTHTYM